MAVVANLPAHTMRGVTDDLIARTGRLFERDGSRYVPTQLARGPWNPNALHGGAPSALFATVCEPHDPGPAAFVARLTVELLRPVPLAPLELRVRTIRPGQEGAVDRSDAARRP